MQKEWKYIALIFFAASLTALQSWDSSKNIWYVGRKWLAGILAGGITLIICDMSGISQSITTILCVIASSFISSIYPIIEKYVKLLTEKKGKEMVGNDKIKGDG